MAAKPGVSMLNADEVAEFGKSHIEALIQTGSILSRGIEELATSLFQLTQTQLDANVSAAKALVGATSLIELGAVHKAYTRTAFDNVVSEASRLSEIVIRVANEAAEPLTTRVQATVDRLSKAPLAA